MQTQPETVEITLRYELRPVTPVDQFDTGRHGNADEEMVLAVTKVHDYVLAKQDAASSPHLEERFNPVNVAKLTAFVQDAHAYLRNAENNPHGDAAQMLTDLYDEVENFCTDIGLIAEFNGTTGTWFLWDGIPSPDEAFEGVIIKQQGDTWSAYGGGFDKPLEDRSSEHALILECLVKIDQENFKPDILVTYDDEATFYQVVTQQPPQGGDKPYYIYP